jgi:hypothetical protein
MSDKDFDIIEAQNRIPRAKRKKDGFNRMDVVNAFNNAFQMMGGVPRLALWANQNPDKFYPLYARLMPSTSINITSEGNKLVIEHSVPSSPLDDFTDLVEPDAEEVPIKRERPSGD